MTPALQDMFWNEDPEGSPHEHRQLVCATSKFQKEKQEAEFSKLKMLAAPFEVKIFLWENYQKCWFGFIMLCFCVCSWVCPRPITLESFARPGPRTCASTASASARSGASASTCASPSATSRTCTSHRSGSGAIPIGRSEICCWDCQGKNKKMWMWGRSFIGVSSFKISRKRWSKTSSPGGVWRLKGKGLYNIPHHIHRNTRFPDLDPMRLAFPHYRNDPNCWKVAMHQTLIDFRFAIARRCTH